MKEQVKGKKLTIMCAICGKVSDEFMLLPSKRRNYFVCSECIGCLSAEEIEKELSEKCSAVSRSVLKDSEA